MRAIVWLETAGVAAGYAGAIVVVNRLLLERHVASPALSIAIAFTIVQILAIIALLGGLLLRKWMLARRTATAERLRRAITDALATQAIGQDQFRRLKMLAKESRRDVTREIVAMISTLRGQPRDRLLAIARELEIETGEEPDRIERLFAAAASGTLMQRAVIAEELEPQAAVLAEQQILRALTASDEKRLSAALDFLFAWKRHLVVPTFEPVLRHADARIRARAFRALPYVPVANPARAILDGLNDADATVRANAADAARKLRVESTTARLVESITDPSREVAVAAAFAVAVMTGGPAILQQQVSGEDRRAATVAFEALEKASLGRIE